MANTVDKHDASQATQPHQNGDSSEDSLAKRTGLKALLGGGAILAIATMAANGGNYVLNIALGRWLSPAEFADANLMVTLMLLVTAIAVALQLLAARYTSVAQSSSTDDIAEPLAAWLQRAALWAGVGTGAFIALLAPVWSNVFRSESPWPFVILAAGMPAYLAQAVGRGVLQGRLAFGQLASTFIIEMVVRVSTALGLVAAGFGVSGATAGLTLSFLATWLAVRRIQPIEAPPVLDALQRIDLRAYIVPIGVLLLGQIIINNGDVLITKSSFERTDAGIYAAIALIGRAVFFLSWSAVTTLFPAVAQRQASGEQSTSLLTGALVAVTGACAVMVAAVAVGGEMFFSGVLGPEYSGVNPLVVKYALATSFFALANLIVTYHLSSNRFVETRILLVGAIIQTALVWGMNSTMTSVIHAQILAMSGLLVAVLTTTYWPSNRVFVDNDDLKVAPQ